MVLAKFSWCLPVQENCGCVLIVLVGFYGPYGLSMAFDGSGFFLTGMIGFSPTCRFPSRYLALFRCCLIAIASFRWFIPVQNSCRGLGMFVAVFIWLLVVP